MLSGEKNTCPDQHRSINTLLVTSAGETTPYVLVRTRPQDSSKGSQGHRPAGPENGLSVQFSNVTRNRATETDESLNASLLHHDPVRTETGSQTARWSFHPEPDVFLLFLNPFGFDSTRQHHTPQRGGGCHQSPNPKHRNQGSHPNPIQALRY